MKLLLLMGIAIALCCPAFADSLTIDRMLLDQATSNLQMQKTEVLAKQLSEQSQIQLLEDQYNTMVLLFKKGSINSVNLANAESDYRQGQARVRLYSQMASAFAAEILFRQTTFRAKYGEASDEEVAKSVLNLQVHKCEIAKLKYEIEDLRLMPETQLQENINNNLHRATESMISRANASFAKIDLLRTGYLSSWRQCKALIENFKTKKL